MAKWEMKNCTSLWREAHSRIKMCKTHQPRTTFGSSDVEKWHAPVAPSAFASQHVQNTSAANRFWKFRCREMARRCGAKRICKSKCTKHISREPLLEVQMSRNGTPLWRQAHLQVNMYKTHQPRTAFGSSHVEKWHTAVARSAFASQNVKNTRVRSISGSYDVQKWHAAVVRSTFASQNVKKLAGSEHFWKLRCPKMARRSRPRHIRKSKCDKHDSFWPFSEGQMSKTFIHTLHS